MDLIGWCMNSTLLPSWQDDPPRCGSTQRHHQDIHYILADLPGPSASSTERWMVFLMLKASLIYGMVLGYKRR